jgi:hypothetical protein
VSPCTFRRRLNLGAEKQFEGVSSNTCAAQKSLDQDRGLYDIYGNVCERISDKYARNYYSISPKVDPTGPSQGTQSRFEYKVSAPRSGKYSLTAQVVTANYDQRLNVSVNAADSEIVMEMPFTVGAWQDSKPVTLTLEEGENTLRFWRNQPPQYGLSIKDFTLTPVK